MNDSTSSSEHQSLCLPLPRWTSCRFVTGSLWMMVMMMVMVMVMVMVMMMMMMMMVMVMMMMM